MSGQNSSAPGRGGRSSSCRPQKTPPGSEARGSVSVDEWGRISVPQPAHGFAELPLTRVPGTSFQVSLFQHMGDRRTQEDRYVVAPRLESETGASERPAFFGVFDGTVGDFASDNVKDIVLPTLLGSDDWRALRNASNRSKAEQQELLRNAFRNMFVVSDTLLLQQCSRNRQHYATSTGVALLVVGDMLVLGHLGDSRIALGRRTDNGEVIGEQATEDHKPDQDHERKRIEECGGMVERLVNHNNKPFIRGGDFMMRKALGEQPMQLQYSRAFGGKDLKIFGLSSNPDVTVTSRAQNRVAWAILASDGLWDVVSAHDAVTIAQNAADQDYNPSEALVRAALLQQSRRKARADNITVLCVQFD